MTHINQRRDTSSAWASTNPVLHLGEVGWETNTLKAKLGDGVTPWNDLPYAIGTAIVDVLDAYPVGSIYLSVNSTSPSLFFGGEWEAWGVGRVPVGVDIAQTEFDSVEKTGGEKDHVLTTDEMPSHTHNGTGRVSSSSGSSPYYVSLVGGFGSPGGYETNPRGGDQAHNNLQPYITCYMWKRTA